MTQLVSHAACEGMERVLETVRPQMARKKAKTEPREKPVEVQPKPEPRGEPAVVQPKPEPREEPAMVQPKTEPSDRPAKARAKPADTEHEVINLEDDSEVDGEYVEKDYY